MSENEDTTPDAPVGAPVQYQDSDTGEAQAAIVTRSRYTQTVQTGERQVKDEKGELQYLSGGRPKMEPVFEDQEFIDIVVFPPGAQARPLRIRPDEISPVS